MHDIIYLVIFVKLNELKCKNCGAILTVPDKAEKVTCKYCKTSFAVEDTYSEAYKHSKGVMDATNDAFQEQVKMIDNIMNNNFMAKFSKIIFILIFVVVLVVFIIAAINMFTDL